MDRDRNPEEDAPASALPAQSAAEAVERLLTDGWREYPDHLTHCSARCFYKRFDTPTPSQQNRERLGVQICLPVYEHLGQASFNLDLTAELPDGSWIRFHNYSLPSDLEACLKLIPRLLATWEFMVSVGLVGTGGVPLELETRINRVIHEPVFLSTLAGHDVDLILFQATWSSYGSFEGLPPSFRLAIEAGEAALGQTGSADVLGS